MKKRILYAVVAGMMLLTATGCGSDKDDSGSGLPHLPRKKVNKKIIRTM